MVEGVYRIVVLMISKRHSDATKDGDVCMLIPNDKKGLLRTITHSPVDCLFQTQIWHCRLLEIVGSYMIPYPVKALTLQAKGVSGDEERGKKYWDE